MEFQKGVLYVRIFNGEISELFYPDEEVPEKYQTFHVKNIARIWSDTAEPNFGGAVECAQHGERTGAGHLIEFREATDADIKTFIEKWSQRAISTVAVWAKDITEYCTALDQKEKERVVRIVEMQAAS